MAGLSWTPLIVPNGGIDETRHPQKIDDHRWAAGSDVEALPDGVRRRAGSSAALSSVLPGAITAVIDYRKSDAVTAVHLLWAAGRLYQVVAGIASQITGSLGTLTGGDNILPSWDIGADRVFITNGIETPKKYYRISSTNYWENEGIAAPTANISLSATGSGGSLATATWEVDYYYWNADLGVPSNRRYGGVGAPSQAIALGENLTITGLPTAVVRTGDRATHIRIEIKKTTDTVFRLAKEVTLGTSSTAIAADERTTEAEYDHAVAPIHAIKLVAENRQFLLNVSGLPYRLMCSAIIGTTPYYESFPENNYRDFGRGDGDYGTALAFIPPRLLVVGFKNSIYAIDARRPLTSDVQTVAKNIGIAGHRSFIVVGQRLYFVSDAKENKGLFVWAPGAEPQQIAGIDDTFKAMNQTRLSLASCAHYAPGDNRFQWWILLSGPAATRHDRILVYDYALGAWTVFTKNAGTRALSVLGTVVDSVGQSRVYGGAYNGQEYLQDSGANDAGISYEGIVTLKSFDYGSDALLKQHRYVDYILQQQTTGGVALVVQRDYGARAALSSSLQHMGSTSAFILGTSVLGGSATLGTAGDRSGRTALRGRGKTFQATISSPTAWMLKGIAFGVQPLGTRRAT